MKQTITLETLSDLRLARLTPGADRYDYPGEHDTAKGVAAPKNNTNKSVSRQSRDRRSGGVFRM